MELEILTPRGREFAGRVDILVLPTHLGEITVLPRHTPLTSVLKSGRMKIKTGKEEISKEIEGGILQVSENKAVILLKKF